MIQAIVTSKTSGRVIKRDYTARQLLDTCEKDLVDEMTKCNCGDEWEDYELVLKGRDEKY